MEFYKYQFETIFTPFLSYLQDFDVYMYVHDG